MSKSKAKLPEHPSTAAIVSPEERLEPIPLMVGDRFEKRGRRVIDWRVNAIANLPHGSPIATFVEIDGTACVSLRVADISEMGFQRIGSASAI